MQAFHKVVKFKLCLISLLEPIPSIFVTTSKVLCMCVVQRQKLYLCYAQLIQIVL